MPNKTGLFPCNVFAECPICLGITESCEGCCGYVNCEGEQCEEKAPAADAEKQEP